MACRYETKPGNRESCSATEVSSCERKEESFAGDYFTHGYFAGIDAYFHVRGRYNSGRPGLAFGVSAINSQRHTYANDPPHYSSFTAETTSYVPASYLAAATLTRAERLIIFPYEATFSR